ncbi:MAG: glyoxylate carboligase [Rhodospirillales bacterium]|nr:glyoxylate carboligase [Rhodospirillales bacterium]
MPKMTAIEAVVQILKSEGVDTVFGIPGAAILPLYEALRGSGIEHILARHEEGGSHMAEGYNRAVGKVGVCLGTSGPAGTDMVTGLYSASADSIPILCITGQAPRAELHREYFQAVDIAAITKPVTKWSVTVMEAAQIPWVFRQAFQIMRSGRPGPVHIDLPIDIQKEIIEYNPDVDVPLEVFKPTPNHASIVKALEMMMEADRPVIIAGGGVVSSDASELLVEFAELTGVPVTPTLMGWTCIPDDHPLCTGMIGTQAQRRCGNASFLESDFVLGIGNRWASRHTGALDAYRGNRKFVHVDVEPTQIGRVFCPDLGIVGDAKKALEMFIEVAREMDKAGKIKRPNEWISRIQERRRTMRRRTDFDNVPIKPQRVFHEINEIFPRNTRFVTAIGLYQIASAQFQRVYVPRHYLICGQAGPLGWEVPASIGAKLADPDTEVVTVVGDYSFQFLIEELAVAAQFKIPFVIILFNNAYLGLIRQASKAYDDMDFQIQLSFDNINTDENEGRGVDFVRVAEGFGCRATRVKDPAKLAEAIEWARAESREQQVPAIVEVITERKTDIAMGPAIDQIKEFEDIIDLPTEMDLSLPKAEV